MQVHTANIPKELTMMFQWLCHDQNKKPISATTGQSDAWQNNLASFEVAEEYGRQHGLGLGFAFNGQTLYYGIDLDSCVDPMTGAIEDWAKTIIDHVQSYSEVSPSFSGLKLICSGHYTGNLPTIVYGPNKHGSHQQQVEFKTGSGYFTVTGSLHPHFSRREIRKVDPVAIYNWLDPNWQPPTDTSNSEPVCGGLSSTEVDEVLKRASAYLKTIPGAISGQGGHNTTFNAACILTQGFCLTPMQAMPLLQVWNQTCSPPWTEKELLHKLKQADARQDGQGRQRGYLLDTPTFGTEMLAPIMAQIEAFNQATGLPAPCSVNGTASVPSSGNSRSVLSSSTQNGSTSTPKRTFAGIDASELCQFVDAETDWLVDGLFSSDQPTIFGAASKATKTTQLVDLSVALATVTPWLNSFRVSRRRKVLFITGESNYKATSKRIRRALDARGLQWNSMRDWLRIEAIHFPSLPSVADRKTITEDVDQWGIDVVIIDPLYRGLQGIDNHRMTEVGDAIIAFGQACKPGSLIISHHVTKSSAREFRVPTLEDLSGAGLAESCGNWWLIGRNEPYRFDRRHDLSITYGGRDEQSGSHRIVFDEVNWTFEIGSVEELNDQRQLERDQHKQHVASEKVIQTKQAIIQIMSNEFEAKPKSWIESQSTFSQIDTRKAIAALCNERILIEQHYKDNRNRNQTGLVLAKNSPVQRMLVDVR